MPCGQKPTSNKPLVFGNKGITMLDLRSVINTHKWLIPTVAILLLLLVILFALGVLSGGKVKSGNTPNNAQLLPNSLQTVKVSRQAAANSLSWQGIVRSRLTVKIAPKLNARIVEVLVHSGDRLKKGDVIARLDDRDLRAAYNASNAAYTAAQAQANQANIEEKRISGLYSKQAATRQNYEAVLSQAKAAQAIANQAASTAQQSKVILNDNVLYAPFDGIVGERLQESGDMGMTNQPVITLLKPDDLRLEVPITNSCTSQIELGMNATVRIDAIQKTLTGTVDEIAPEIDPQTRSQQIKIRLPNTNDLQQGQFGWLELACQSEQQTLLIPASAIVHYGQLETVKVLEDKQLHIRHIRTGKQYGDKLEVLSGLQENETIVLENGLAQ
jgi:RND family efflux transporter MFP subunit